MTPGIQELMRQIEQVWDGYRRDVYVARDLDAALAATDATTSLVNLPVGTGAADRDALRRHLADDVLPHLPADLTRTRISRTVDRFRVVDEERVSFTHDVELPWLLPGVAPTHGTARVVAVTVATLRQARISAQRTLWDHAGLLTQLGLPPDAVRIGPVATPGPEPERATTGGGASWW